MALFPVAVFIQPGFSTLHEKLTVVIHDGGVICGLVVMPRELEEPAQGVEFVLAFEHGLIVDRWVCYHVSGIAVVRGLQAALWRRLEGSTVWILVNVTC